MITSLVHGVHRHFGRGQSAFIVEFKYTCLTRDFYLLSGRLWGMKHVISHCITQSTTAPILPSFLWRENSIQQNNRLLRAFPSIYIHPFSPMHSRECWPIMPYNCCQISPFCKIPSWLTFKADRNMSYMAAQELWKQII